LNLCQDHDGACCGQPSDNADSASAVTAQGQVQRTSLTSRSDGLSLMPSKALGWRRQGTLAWLFAKSPDAVPIHGTTRIVYPDEKLGVASRNVIANVLKRSAQVRAGVSSITTSPNSADALASRHRSYQEAQGARTRTRLRQRVRHTAIALTQRGLYPSQPHCGTTQRSQRDAVTHSPSSVARSAERPRLWPPQHGTSGGHGADRLAPTIWTSCVCRISMDRLPH